MKKHFLLIAALLCLLAAAAHAQDNGNKGTGSLIRIPVVVHVLYNAGNADIPDATIRGYLTEVNKNMRGWHTSPLARQIFDTLRADTEIELCLAERDPSGNGSTGITHTLTRSNGFSVYPPIGVGQPSRGGKENWPSDRYLNIWIAPVEPEPPIPGCPPFVVGGTATIDPAWDTVGVLLALNQPAANMATVLTHEVGHFFGLYHLEFDMVDDTPNGMYELFPAGGCQAYPASCSAIMLNQNSTQNDGPYWTMRPVPIDPPDMLENFMNLATPCAYMFTRGQGVLMRNYIHAHWSSLVNGCARATSAGTMGKAEGYFFIASDPASHRATLINRGMSAGMTYEMYDLNGQVLIRGRLPADQETLPEAAPGVYLIRCGGQTKKVVLGL